MLRRVALVRTDVSEERSASFIRVARIGELGTTLAVTNSPILTTLMKEALSFSETSVLRIATRRNIPEDAILHSHRRENSTSYLTIIDYRFEKNEQMKCMHRMRYIVWKESILAAQCVAVQNTCNPDEIDETCLQSRSHGL
jgi:hypothetical protein